MNRPALAVLAILASALGGCREAPSVPEAHPETPDVSGTYVSFGSPDGVVAAAASATTDSVWITLETVGHFVYGRWREPYSDGAGYFDWVVTGHLSWDESDMFTLVLEYTSIARGRCHLWGALDGLWNYTGQTKRWPAFSARRYCEAIGELEMDTLYFIRLDP